MITKEKITEANTGLQTVPVKGKDYAMVTERVKRFREICPSGTITTEILEMHDGVVTMKATILDDDGKIVSTGLAQEKEESSFINKTSYIENAETSAVGRALGFLGIGIDGSMVSAEEVANAINNQKLSKDDSLDSNATPAQAESSNKPLTDNQLKILEGWYRGEQSQIDYLNNNFGVMSIDLLSMAQASRLIALIQKKEGGKE